MNSTALEDFWNRQSQRTVLVFSDSRTRRKTDGFACIKIHAHVCPGVRADIACRLRPSPVATTSAIGAEKQVLTAGVIFTREGGLQLNYDPQQGATYTRIDDAVIFETSDEELPLYYSKVKYMRYIDVQSVD